MVKVLSSAIPEDDPSSWTAAISSPNRAFWLHAAFQEICQIVHMRTFDFVPFSSVPLRIPLFLLNRCGNPNVISIITLKSSRLDGSFVVTNRLRTLTILRLLPQWPNTFCLPSWHPLTSNSTIGRCFRLSQWRY